jgi:hypothetical protein
VIREDGVALKAMRPALRTLVWVLQAGVVGFAASATFSSLLQLHRPAFVAAYAVVAGTFVLVYLATTKVDAMAHLRRRWAIGLLGGLAVGILLVRGVARQPRSAAPHGGELALALVWFGVVYGIVDAILLNVVPVLSVYSARRV